MYPMGGIGRIFFTILVIIPIILLGVFAWNYNQLPVFKQQIDGVVQQYGGFSGKNYFRDNHNITHFKKFKHDNGYDKYVGQEHARIYKIEAAHHFMFIATPRTDSGKTWYGNNNPNLHHKPTHLVTRLPYKDVPFGNKIYYQIYVSIPKTLLPLDFWGNQAQRLRVTRPEYTVSEKSSEFDKDQNPRTNGYKNYHYTLNRDSRGTDFTGN